MTDPALDVLHLLAEADIPAAAISFPCHCGEIVTAGEICVCFSDEENDRRMNLFAEAMATGSAEAMAKALYMKHSCLRVM